MGVGRTPPIIYFNLLFDENRGLGLAGMGLLAVLRRLGTILERLGPGLGRLASFLGRLGAISGRLGTFCGSLETS